MGRPAYCVTTGDVVADRDRVLALWQQCGFGGASADNAARYDWLYLRNPQGLGRLYLLHAPGAGEIVGAAGVGARRFHTTGNSETSQSGILVDFVVHPAHRSLFPALVLQKAVCEQEFRSCGFVYGLPVQKAVPVVARLEGAMRFVSSTYVGVVRTAPFLRRRMPGMPLFVVKLLAVGADLLLRVVQAGLTLASAKVRCVRANGEYPDVTSLAAEIAREGDTHIGDRSPEVLAWRARSPGRHFEIVTFRRRRTGELLGYAMYALENADLSIVDFLVPAKNRLARGIWLAILRMAAELGAKAVRVEFGGCPRVIAQLRSTGYMHAGFRPGFVIFPANSSGVRRGSWWFTRLDEDV